MIVQSETVKNAVEVVARGQSRRSRKRLADVGLDQVLGGDRLVADRDRRQPPQRKGGDEDGGGDAAGHH